MDLMKKTSEMGQQAAQRARQRKDPAPQEAATALEGLPPKFEAIFCANFRRSFSVSRSILSLSTSWSSSLTVMVARLDLRSFGISNLKETRGSVLLVIHRPPFSSATRTRNDECGDDAR